MIAADRTNRLKIAVLAILGCYWLALVIGTHVPHTPPAILALTNSDKWLHLSAYAGLAFLIGLNGSLRRAMTRRQWIAVPILLAVFGAVDEVTQIPVGRECDLLDWAADVAGSIAGVAIFLAVAALYRSQAWRPRRA
jgi:VanZ family protein